MVSDIETRLIHWPQTYRIISSRYPPIDIFEKVLSADEFEIAFYIESDTNDRLRDQIGRIDLVAPEDRLYGPGSGAVMAAFTHPNTHGSRFSDGTYGIYYCARDQETAIAETVYHASRRLALDAEPPQRRQMRVYLASLAAEMVELRSRRAHPELLDPDDYGPSRAFGARLKEMNAWGLVYPSVRRARGRCAGVFRPKALSNCVQGAHLNYDWDGASIRVSMAA